MLILKQSFLSETQERTINPDQSPTGKVNATDRIADTLKVTSDDRSQPQRDLYNNFIDANNEAVAMDFLWNVEKVLCEIETYALSATKELNISSINNNEKLALRIKTLKRIGHNMQYFLFNQETLHLLSNRLFEIILSDRENDDRKQAAYIGMFNLRVLLTELMPKDTAA